LESFLENCCLLPFSNIFAGGRGELDVESSLSDGYKVAFGVVVMCASFNGCMRTLDFTKFFDASRCVGDFLSLSDHFEFLRSHSPFLDRVFIQTFTNEVGLQLWGNGKCFAVVIYKIENGS
jgi:hypothetical protein